jgi:hypothetical protein
MQLELDFDKDRARTLSSNTTRVKARAEFYVGAVVCCYVEHFCVSRSESADFRQSQIQI